MQYQCSTNVDTNFGMLLRVQHAGERAGGLQRRVLWELALKKETAALPAGFAPAGRTPEQQAYCPRDRRWAKLRLPHKQPPSQRQRTLV